MASRKPTTELRSMAKRMKTQAIALGLLVACKTLETLEEEEAGGPFFSEKSHPPWMPRLLPELDKCISMKHNLYRLIGPLPHKYEIVDVYQKFHFDSAAGEGPQALMFKMTLESMEANLNGDANAVFAWYPVTKAELDQVTREGLIPVTGLPRDPGPRYGLGLYLYPYHLARQSLLSAPSGDAAGLRHLVLCRVILGRTEEIPPGSSQLGPSSSQFDSGIVSQQKSPLKYIVWYPNLKTNVIPKAAVSVKLDTSGSQPETEEQRYWELSTSLVMTLLGILPQSSRLQLNSLHNDFLERKISWGQFLSDIWQLAGDSTSDVKHLLEKEKVLEKLFQGHEADTSLGAPAKVFAQTIDAIGEVNGVGGHSGRLHGLSNGVTPSSAFGMPRHSADLVNSNGSAQPCVEDFAECVKSLEIRLEQAIREACGVEKLVECIKDLVVKLGKTEI